MKSYQNNKKKEERDLLKYFSQAFPDFPNGKIIETESPDFVITSNPKRKLGIELTRLTQPKLSNQEFTIAQINSLKKIISSKAQKLFDSRNDYPLYLSIFFNDNIKVTRNDMTEVAENIALDVQNHITGSDRKSIFQIHISNPIAEDYVDLIHGIYHPNVKSSYWSSAGGYVVPALSNINNEND